MSCDLRSQHPLLSGSIPEGWQLVKLSDLGEVNRGRSRHRPRYAEHLYGGPYPFIQTGDIKSSNGRIKEYKQTYSEAGLAQSRLWSAGTMCITIAANIAETGILAFPACFPDSVIGFIADKSKCDVYFVEYMFRYLKNKIQREATGSVQDNINLETLERIQFPLPPISEQFAISKVLGNFDAKIGINQQMNRTLEAVGQAVFERWFVDFEFPNEEGKPYKSSGGEMVYNQVSDKEIPKGWIIKPIDEIADFLNGLALQKFPAREGEESMPVIKIRELRQGITESSDKANLDLPEGYVVDNGDILFSWSGSLEVVIWGFGKGALNQHLFKVTSSKYPKWFFYYWILHYLPEYRQIAADKATTMGHIQRHHLTASQVIVPDDKTLERMDRLLSPILERISGIKVETKVLSEIRDLLLPKLMSGKIRVPLPKDNERHLDV